MILKMNLVKDYDKVNWTLLRLVFLQIGLSLEVTNWIMGCVTLANFVVLINDTPIGIFKIHRGLRRGFPSMTLTIFNCC